MTDTQQLKQTIISIISGKGGTGKTTVAINLGASLALFGRKVLIVDADIGLKNVDIYLGLEELVTGDICDILNEKSKPEDVIIKHPNIENLSVIPAALSRDKEEMDEELFDKTIKFFAKNYDYVLIDSPHGIGKPLKMTLAPAHKVIVVTTPDRSAILKSDKIIGVAEETGIDHKNINLVINKVENHLRNEGIQKSKEEILEVLKLELLTEIPFDYDICSCNEMGKPITLSGEKETTGIFLNLARSIEGEKIEPNIVKKKTILRRILGG